jgi:signal transduction histidine kinase/CheY-like chemotaxis protein/PAS domain-containing protein/HPt (histidine-containing phosphotransfer) domain-containing protein
MDTDAVSKYQQDDKSSAIFQKMKLQKGEKALSLAQEISSQNLANETKDEKDERFIFQFYLFPLPTYIWKIVDDDMILIDINQAAMKYSGPKIKELLGHTASTIYYDMPQVLKWMNECRKNLHVVRKQFYLSLRTTGERKYLDASWAFFPPGYILFLVSDITDQKNQQTELEKSVEKSRQDLEKNNKNLKSLNNLLEQEIHSHKQTESLLKKEQDKLNYLLENLPAIVFLIQRDQTISYANKYFKKYIGDKLYSYCYEAMYCNIENCKDCIAEKVIETKEVQTQEWVSQSGKVFAMYYYPFSLNNKGPIVLCLGIDITQRKQMEEQLHQARQLAEKSSRFKSQFLARMSHEIRTPMNGVLGMSDLLLHTNISPEQKSYLLTLKNSGETLLSIINDILDISKIEAGKLELHMRPFNLVSLINDVYQLLLPKAQEKKIRFSYDLQHDMHHVYTSDPIRIRQILFNIIGNAIKFTNDGAVEIYVSQKDTESENTGILFEIKDSGSGIEKEQHENIFKSFTQVNVSQQDFQGTGLGLSICYQLIRLLDGKIWLESEINHGTTFFIYLELQKNENVLPELHEKKAQQIPDMNKFANLNILLVEDNPDNRQIFKFYMEKLGCSFDSAVNGLNAIAQASKKRYDIIFMDIMMPLMDGVQATARIREMISVDRQPLIIALTADAIAGQREHYLKKGFDDYCAKPFNLNNLQNIFSKHFSGKHEQQQIRPDHKSHLQTDFDWDQINELKKELKDSFSELIHLTLNECPTIIRSLQLAVNQLDYDKIKHNAHALKSILSIFGSNCLSKSCKEMALAATNQSEQQIQEIFHMLEKDYDKFRNFLENQLGRL